MVGINEREALNKEIQVYTFRKRFVMMMTLREMSKTCLLFKISHMTVLSIGKTGGTGITRKHAQYVTVC